MSLPWKLRLLFALTALARVMKVEVRAFATLSNLVGGGFLEVELPEGSTVGDLLAELARRLGRPFREAVMEEDGHLSKYVKVFVSGRDIDSLSGLDTTLKDGDEVALLPPAGGG